MTNARIGCCRAGVFCCFINYGLKEDALAFPFGEGGIPKE